MVCQMFVFARSNFVCCHSGMLDHHAGMFDRRHVFCSALFCENLTKKNNCANTYLYFSCDTVFWRLLCFSLEQIVQIFLVVIMSRSAHFAQGINTKLFIIKSIIWLGMDGCVWKRTVFINNSRGNVVHVGYLITTLINWFNNRTCLFQRRQLK